MNRFVLMTCATLALVACGTRQPKVFSPSFDEAVYRPFAKPGTSTVTGSSYLVTRGGDVKRGAARTVMLIPDTPFLHARIDPWESNTDGTTYSKLEWSGESKAIYDQALVFNLTTIGDIDGKFVFTKVPAGKYIIETQLFWQYMGCGFLGCGLRDTGAVLRKTIEVAEGATVDVQLTTVIPQ